MSKFRPCVDHSDYERTCRECKSEAWIRSYEIDAEIEDLVKERAALQKFFTVALGEKWNGEDLRPYKAAALKRRATAKGTVSV